MNWFADLLEDFDRNEAWLFPNCRRVSRTQSIAPECKLAFLQRFGLWLHILFCKWCRRYRREVRFLRDAGCNRYNEMVESPTHRMSVKARERIKRLLNTRQDESNVRSFFPARLLHRPSFAESSPCWHTKMETWES